MAVYFEEAGLKNIEEITEADLKSYLNEMKKAEFASSTISRSTASIRAFFHYLFKKGMIYEDPSEGLKAPKRRKKRRNFLRWRR